jgi:hypothetical protein
VDSIPLKTKAPLLDLLGTAYATTIETTPATNLLSSGDDGGSGDTVRVTVAFAVVEPLRELVTWPVAEWSLNHHLETDATPSLALKWDGRGVRPTV